MTALSVEYHQRVNVSCYFTSEMKSCSLRSLSIAAIQCNPLDGIENGVITYAPDTAPNYDLGTVATYECDPGYFLDLSLGGCMTRTCVNDDGLDAIGDFSGQAPRCIRKSLIKIHITICIIIVSVTLINVQVHVTIFHCYSTE